jgi:hypothetical protein
VALGDSWISPTDFLAAWGPYLNALSLLDGQALSNTAMIAANAQVHTLCISKTVFCFIMAASLLQARSARLRLAALCRVNP